MHCNMVGGTLDLRAPKEEPPPGSCSVCNLHFLAASHGSCNDDSHQNRRYASRTCARKRSTSARNLPDLAASSLPALSTTLAT